MTKISWAPHGHACWIKRHAPEKETSDASSNSSFRQLNLRAENNQGVSDQQKKRPHVHTCPISFLHNEHGFSVPIPRAPLVSRDLIVVSELFANLIYALRSVKPLALRAGAALRTRQRFFAARQCACLRAYSRVQQVRPRPRMGYQSMNLYLSLSALRNEPLMHCVAREHSLFKGLWPQNFLNRGQCL